MNLVKAEILWTRVCPLGCSYCNMNTGKSNTRSKIDWRLGMDSLKKLGTEFACFYGAEPLADFDNLPETVGYAEKIGINTSIITSGCVPEFEKKLQILHEKGAKSISMSYDMVPLGKSSGAKMGNAISGLNMFKSLGGVRDVAAIATVTRNNYHLLPDTVKMMSDLGIWFFFDFIHPDRGQKGSKCKGAAGDLLFRPEDIEPMSIILRKISELKKSGYLVHTSDAFCDEVLKNNGERLLNYNWKCNKSEVFPSWVTIDYDGRVYYCDDYMERRSKFDMTSLFESWERFVADGKDSIEKCRGCCWNTHIDAHLIKQGTLPITDYIHGLEK